MDEKEKRETWRGVHWLYPNNGICPRHGTPVGPVTNLCFTCHQEQIAAARSNSREWERAKTKKEREKLIQVPGAKEKRDELGGSNLSAFSNYQ
jgi:hypothetical protein